MLGTALYFPHIDIHDPAWLRSALLFWDDIQTIAPSAIENPYTNDDTLICYKEGYLKPLRCDLHPSVIDELGRKILTFIYRRGDFRSATRQVGAKTYPTIDGITSADRLSWEVKELIMDFTGVHPDKMAPGFREIALRLGIARMHRGKIPARLRHALRGLEFARMHPEKLPQFLRDLLEYDESQNEDGHWLLVGSRFASAYMAALASKLANQLDLSPLTSEIDAHGMSFRFLFDDIMDNTASSAPGALLNLTMRGISIDCSVPIQNVIQFKCKRKDQYLEFKAQIGELSAALEGPAGESGEAVLAKAQNIYNTKVERGLRQFKRELEQNSIASAWEGALTAATVSASSTTALAYFSGMTGPALLGAAASVSAISVGVKGYLAGRKLRISSPYSYLHDVHENFGLPEFS